MKDRYREIARSLETDLRRNEAAKKEADSKKEEVRVLFEKSAREAVARYENERRKLEPVLREKIETVIKPWWQEVEESGLYELVAKWQNNRGRNIVLNDSERAYFWPDGLHESLRESRPFNTQAEFELKYPDFRLNGPDFEELIKDRVENGRHNWWHAYVYFSEPSIFRGLFISQYPLAGGGCGFNSNRYKVRVGFRDGEKLPNIHPIVFTSFAEEIEDGRVLAAIEKSLRRRR